MRFRTLQRGPSAYGQKQQQKMIASDGVEASLKVDQSDTIAIADTAFPAGESAGTRA